MREAHDARGGRGTATDNTRDPKGAEVAVFPWVDQALHAGSRGRSPPPAQAFRSGVVVGCVHHEPPVGCGVGHPITYQSDITLIGDMSTARRSRGRARAWAHHHPGRNALALRRPWVPPDP